MNETWAPGDVPVATRGEFLAQRATAVHDLERRIGSPVDLFVNSGLVVGAAFALMLAGAALSDARVETFNVVFTVVMTAAALVTVPLMVRRALRTRKLMATIVAWETAEGQSRSLPPGHVRPDLRMPFDAREDADFEAVAHAAEVAAQFRPSATWLVWRSLPAGLGIAPGLVLVLGGFGPERGPQEVTALVSGVYLLTSCLVAAVGMVRMGLRLRRLWQMQKAEVQAWRVERIGPVAAAEVERASGRLQALLVAPFVVTSFLILVLSVGTSSPDAVAFIVAVVVLAGIVTGVAVLVRRFRRRSAAPTGHDLTPVPPD
jgi:hypothetical protein